MFCGGRFGKTTCTVNNWCQNTKKLELNAIDKIAKLLNVEIRELLTTGK